APARAARRGGPLPRPDRGGAASRGAAHDLRGAPRLASPAHPSAGPCPASPERPLADAGVRARGRGRGPAGRGGAPPLRPRRRAAVARLARQALGRRARPRPPSLRLGRLVAGRAPARAVGALRGLRQGRGLAPGPTPDPVRRLRAVAAAVAAGRAAGAPPLLLEGAAARSARGPVAAGR